MSDRRAHTADEPPHAPERPDVDTGAEDAVLVAAARVNRQAFRPLYERYVHLIYRYCVVRLGSRDAAEDATSEVFLKAVAGLGGYRGGIFLAWLYRIASSVIADTRRRDGRSPHTLSLDAAGHLSEPDRDTDTAIVLRAALDALPDDLRSTLELQLAGWTSEQIGAALGKSPSTVRMARARALDLVRRELTEPEVGTTPRRGGVSC